MAEKKHVTVGCIGCGAMGSAMIRGLKRSDGYTVYGYEPAKDKAEALAKEGIAMLEDVQQIARNCQVILIAVKPYMVGKVLQEIKEDLLPQSLLISVAAGLSLESMRKSLGKKVPLVRVMPNTPALVGAGQFALCFDDPQVKESDKLLVRRLFAELGQSMDLPEESINAFAAIAGCGPAYVFYVMDAVAEAAVSLGFPRAQAHDLARGLFKGSALLAEEAGEHFATLREAVCSPGGTTIAAINHMDRTAVRGHIIDAIFKAFEKGKTMV